MSQDFCSYKIILHVNLFADRPKELEKYSTHSLSLFIWITYNSNQPIPVAERSKAWVSGRSLSGIAGSNPTGGMDVCPEES
jgi:hypothetical protein